MAHPEGGASLFVPLETPGFALIACPLNEVPLRLLRWSAGVYVLSPNGGSDYWQIKLWHTGSSGFQTLLATLSTLSTAADTNAALTVTSFALTTIPANTQALWTEVVMNGSPGGFFYRGNFLWVEDA
jgi:hypothetical protein